MNKLLLTSAVIATAFSAVAAVTPNPLPTGVTAVSPVQGIVDTGANVNPLGVGEIAVTFSSSPTVNPDATGIACVYYGDDTTPLYTATVANANVDAMGLPTGGVTFKAAVVEPGTYRVTIPEGYWYLGADATPSPALDLNYEILDLYTVTPRPGVVDQLTAFTFTFNADEVVVDPSVTSVLQVIGSDKDYNVTYVSGDEPAVLTGIISDTDGGTLDILDTPGSYLYHIEAGAFKLITYGPDYPQDPADMTSVSSPEIRLTYEVAAMPAPAIVPEPGTVQEFTSFTLTYPEDFTVWMVDNMGTSAIYPMKPNGELEANPICKLKATDDRANSQVTLNIVGEGSVKPADGTYVLKLAPRMMSGMYNGEFISTPQFEYVYKVENSVIVEINPVDSQNINVFSINGVRILNDANPAAVKTLPAGLYIVNGRKVIVK